MGLEKSRSEKTDLESRVISIQSIVILQNKYCEKGFPGGLAKVACLCCFRGLDFQVFPQKADFLATLVRFLSPFRVSFPPRFTNTRSRTLVHRHVQSYRYKSDK